MKKFVLIIALFAILFAVSAQAQTEAGKLPADVQTVIQKAIKAEQADPPIDVEFLFDALYDKIARQYIEVARLPLRIPLGEGSIMIGGDYDGRIQVKIIKDNYIDHIECHNDGPYLSGIVQKNENPRRYDSAVQLTAYLRSHRQSEFWAALKSAIQKNSGKE
jgi:hypothetical protein